MNDNKLGAYNIADMREMARRRLPGGIFKFINRGIEDEVSLRPTREVFERIKLTPRTLVDVSNRIQEVTDSYPARCLAGSPATARQRLRWKNKDRAPAR